ncbi:MAG: tetratricopeptide repeat protein [Candidatus Eiseniibacteriota bacterium]
MRIVRLAFMALVVLSGGPACDGSRGELGPEEALRAARELTGRSPRQAAKVLAPLLAQSPVAPEVRVAAGDIALESDDPAAAVAHFREAARTSADPALLLEAGRGMARAGFPDDGIAVVRRVLDGGDPGPEARYTLAWILEKAERYPECVREYSGLLADHPDYVPAYRNLGALMARDGELPRAIRLWRRGLEHAPGDAGLEANIREATEALELEFAEGEGEGEG